MTESQEGMQEQAQETEQETTGVLQEDPWRDALDDELLEGRRIRRRLTRAQKCQERKNCWQKEGGAGGMSYLDFGAAQVRELQITEESLAEIRQLLKDGHPEFVEKESLIYRVQKQIGKEEAWERRNQLVLPKKC